MENRIATTIWLVGGKGRHGLDARPEGGVMDNRIAALWLVGGQGRHGLDARPGG